MILFLLIILQIDGRQTLNENIADNGGIKLAYDVSYGKFIFVVSVCVFSTLLAEAFPSCFSALYCHSLRGFGCSRFVLVVSVPRKRPLQTAVWDSC